MKRHKKFLWVLMMCVVSLIVLMAIPANLVIAISAIITDIPMWLRIGVIITTMINVLGIGYLFDRILNINEPDFD